MYLEGVDMEATMSTITFDKLSFIDKLKAGGVTEEKARLHADALDGALRDAVATKSDIMDLKDDIRSLELRIVKWVIPLLLGQAVMIIGLVKLIGIS